MTTSSNNNENTNTLYSKIHLDTLDTQDGRSIAYSTAGVPQNPAVLFFYPGGGNRRMLLSFVEEMQHVFLICVNRPGKGGTSPSSRNKAHLDTALDDIVEVLNHLDIDKVSVMCMCAGTPFAMRFCVKHPERTTGNFLGISSWVQPADCGYENTSLKLYLASHSPSLISPLVGSVMSSIGSSLTSLPTTWVTSALRGKLTSDEEREAFDAKFGNEDDFSTMMKWMQQEKGGQGADLKVLFSGGLVDYAQLGEFLSKVDFWHGTKDAMVAYVGAEWLQEQIDGSTLHTVEEGSHEGCQFGLHPPIVDALKSFGRDESR